MASPFLTKPELRKITGTDNAVEQLRILKEYGLMPFAPNGNPVIYRDAVISMQSIAPQTTEINLAGLNVP